MLLCVNMESGIVQCKRCGHGWKPVFVTVPKVCPICKNWRWNLDRVRPTESERFWKKVRKTKTCWLWTAVKSEGGYGQFHVKGSGKTRKRSQAHRFAYEEVNGRIPDGLSLDHRCRVRACVNPGHLRPMPIRDNTLLGDGPSARNNRKRFCSHGHPLSGENLILRKEGGRKCKACAKRLNNGWRHKPGIRKHLTSYLRKWDIDKCPVCNGPKRRVSKRCQKCYLSGD